MRRRFRSPNSAPSSSRRRKRNIQAGRRRSSYEMVAAVLGQPQAARRRLRHRRAQRDPRIHAADGNDPQPVVEVPSADAPVHQVVLKTATRSTSPALPFHLQHEFDGAHLYLRRDRLQRGSRHRKHQCRLPPADVARPPHHAREPLAAVRSQELLSRLRRARGDIAGELRDRLASAGLSSPPGCAFRATSSAWSAPCAASRCRWCAALTNGVLAPADAEMIIEGYFDELGYREKEGPTASSTASTGRSTRPGLSRHRHHHAQRRRCTRRCSTAAAISGWTDSGNLCWVNAELQIWQALRAAGIEPAAVCSACRRRTAAQHARVALRAGTARGGAARDLGAPRHPAGKARLHRRRRRRRLLRGADGVGHGHPLPGGDATS